MCIELTRGPFGGYLRVDAITVLIPNPKARSTAVLRPRRHVSTPEVHQRKTTTRNIISDALDKLVISLTRQPGKE